jgi:NAD(P)-dependent dehydrogenase (short-subunit alcohol dehydrogenase family)
MLNDRSVADQLRDGNASLLLRDQVAIVTGAAGGLGRCEAEAIAARGCRVVVADIVDPVETAKAIVRSGGVAISVQVDLTDAGVADALVERAFSEWGDLHHLVNNAGVVDDAMCFNLSTEQWKRVLDVNLTAPFLLSRAVAARWRERHQAGERGPRVIVNTSSESGLYGNAGQANYAAAKAGVVALTLTLAAELDRYGVRANVIAPRARTPMSAEAFGELPQAAGFDPFSPQAVADVVAWLLSDAAADVTGQVLVTHGGGIEVLCGWSLARRIQQTAPWTDEALLALREQLFDGSARNLPRPVAELFLAGE